MTDERLLFDRKLLRARRARFAHEIAAHEFLLAHVAREIAERVALMLRPFPLALDLGAYHGLLGRSVAQLPSVGEMIYAESVFEFAALMPAARACLRRGFAALQGGEPQSHRLGARAASRERSSRRADPDQARARSGRTVHGGGARRGRAHRASPGAARGRGGDARRREPAGRALRRCAGLWRAPSARGLRPSRGRCRDADSHSTQPRAN